MVRVLLSHFTLKKPIHALLLTPSLPKIARKTPRKLGEFLQRQDPSGGLV